jgi:formate dehydrogenase major subunit
MCDIKTNINYAKELTVELNGEQVKGREGETILNLAKRQGIEIPTLCNDPRLEPYSSCYLCVVEVEGMRGHQPSCSTKISEGMKVVTDNQAIKEARKTALDLIMSNHYADCQAPCKDTCPAGVDVQGYISLIDKGRYSEAVALIKETNPLPAICGRVCVRPCEAACRRNLLDEGAPVGIDYMKRFASDYDLLSEDKFIPKVEESTGKKVAVIGAGPGGLSAAHFLQIKGHQVDIFEANPEPGGWLRYGIPEYRLPNDLLDAEVKNITDLGVNINYNKKFGENISYSDIKDKYDATVLTIGSQKGTLIGVKGDDAQNVFSGVDFLRNMEVTGQKMDFRGKTIAVIGGGNTAMDCCRTSIRCNAEKVYVIYRRTEAEMPANPIEIHESKLEGVEYLFLNNPTEVNKDENGVLKSLTVTKMQLGEADASGRRRPIPVEGSEYELEVDYVLAAIGQKTDVNFIDDINKYAKDGQLDVNRWGDIDADKHTLQTGIQSVFAAGDGVTGAATIIEAIAQAKTAAHSCDQYLKGEEIKPAPAEFLSKKDNFKKQVKEDYVGKYIFQKRQEMPVLAADERFNFEEVELGYASEEVCRTEAGRCLECGCVEYYDCDLKKYATDYNADQKRYAGDYHEYQIDFSHPFIEIDNNKCILCSRCIRMCKEVVGANALGLVNRGFDTYVAPSMNMSLLDTNCESCGLCISTCPTGAISENFEFKPGPVVESTAETICNFCSLGCSIDVKHHNQFVMKVKGGEGMVNKDGNICQMAKFGYNYLNDESRIKHPMKKGDDGQFVQITWDEAYDLIAERKSNVEADANIFAVSPRMSNEEIYLAQKLARAAFKTNNIISFANYGKTAALDKITEFNMPISDIHKADKVILIGDNIAISHPVASYKIYNSYHLNKLDVELICLEGENNLDHKYDSKLEIKSHYHFFRAVNHYLLHSGLQNELFINSRTENFDDYKQVLLAENYDDLIQKSGVSSKVVKDFAVAYNLESDAIIVFAEKNVSEGAALEIKNACLITGKLGKNGSGLIALKDKNNSQGLIDMGARVDLGITNNDFESSISKMKSIWNISDVNSKQNDAFELLFNSQISNLFIFGEDPVGSANDREKYSSLVENTDFVVVQDYFMTDTAELADLILPATFNLEEDGSYTNTSKFIQFFSKKFKSNISKGTINQFIDLLLKFGVNGLEDVNDVKSEIISFFDFSDEEKLKFNSSQNHDLIDEFKYSCDVLEKIFDEKFYSELD